MSILKTPDGRYLINESPVIQFGSIRQARSLYHTDLQRQRDKAAQLRLAGLDIYAASDAGTFDDPAYVAPSQAVDMSVVYPSSWNGATVEIEQLSENRFRHVFVVDGVQRSVIGSSPQNVVDRLDGTFDPEIKAYLKTIKPEPVAVVIPTAAPIPLAPNKILRPGSRAERMTEQDWVEMDAERAKKQAPKTPPAEFEYQEFFDRTSYAESKKRSQSDPAFLAWLNKPKESK